MITTNEADIYIATERLRCTAEVVFGIELPGHVIGEDADHYVRMADIVQEFVGDRLSVGGLQMDAELARECATLASSLEREAARIRAIIAGVDVSEPGLVEEA